MEITLNYNQQNYSIKFNNNIIFFGQNTTFKNNFLFNLSNGLEGKKKNILINGNTPNPKDYNIIIINEENDFNNEFKFVKNNTLKKLIYDDIISKVNEDKIIKYTNEIFNVIDDKVNTLLDRKLNKKSDNNISFQIEIPNVNAVIEKFTNIYIDDVLLTSNDISKSMKRKLLYQLYFSDIKDHKDQKYFVIIHNFDAYLTTTETIELLNKINHLSSDNCHFILSSSNNIFEYLSLELFNIYKISNKLLPLSLLEDSIKNYLIKREYESSKETIDFNKYYTKNEHLIIQEEIDTIKNKIINYHPYLLSKILNNNNIKIYLTKPKNITSEYVICNSKEDQKLFTEISNKFID